MSAPFGFPPGAPGAMMPGAQQPQQPAAAFVLDIPPDPSWEPFETTDVLPNDGYYCAQITKESPRNDSNKSSGIFMTLQIVDDDAKGKNLSRFLPDSKSTTKNTWFVWRGLLRSIYGGEAGKALQGFRYTPGALTNAYVYIKTAAYMDDGVMRTGVDSWSTREEWEANRAKGTHRWPAKAPQATGGGVGALPGGLPGSFPGGGGLPGGGPSMPAFPPGQQAATPQPTAAPMATAPTSAGFPPPVGAPVSAQPAAAPSFPPQQAAAPPPPAAAPPAAAVAAPPPFQFAPPAAAPAVPPAANGAAPPSNAAAIMASFPPPPPGPGR